MLPNNKKINEFDKGFNLVLGVDVDYDMVFGCGGGRALSTHPFLLNTTAFTLAFWVAFSSNKKTGNVLTLYGVK